MNRGITHWLGCQTCIVVCLCVRQPPTDSLSREQLGLAVDAGSYLELADGLKCRLSLKASGWLKMPTVAKSLRGGGDSSVVRAPDS